MPVTISLPKFRIGLVGAGPWAEDIHLPVLRDHPSVLFVGVWDRTPAKAKRLGEANGVPTIESYESLLESVDAVSFAVAPNAQAALAEQAVSLGRHVLLEKPLAFSLTEAESLVAAIEDAKVASVVMFTRRFEPKTARALAAIADERDWTSAGARLMSGAMRPGTAYTASEWRQRYGVLWDIGPHILSMLLPVLGEVVSVEATQDEQNTVCLRMTHVNGGESESVMSLYAEPEQQGESYVFRAGDHVARLDVRLETTARRQAYANALESLITLATKGVRHPCSPEFALRVGRILVAANTSLQRGAPQSVDSPPRVTA